MQRGNTFAIMTKDTHRSEEESRYQRAQRRKLRAESRERGKGGDNLCDHD
jgi:hypothetical protein